MIKSNISLSAWIVSLLSVSWLVADAPSFHLKNKTKTSIQVDVLQLQKSITGIRSVQPKDDLTIQNLNLSIPTVVEIYFCESKEACKLNLPTKLVAHFETERPIYIKFNDSKFNLEVQKGVVGFTTKGYNLKNAAQIISQNYYVGSMVAGKKQYTRVNKVNPATESRQGVEKFTKSKEISISKETKPVSSTATQLTGVQKMGVQPEAPVQTQAATRTPPVLPPSKKQYADLPDALEKKSPSEPDISQKMVFPETEVTKPQSAQLSWQEFPEADKLRKKLTQGDQSPFVARKVLGLNVGASESEIRNKASKLISFYRSDSFTGDMSLVPDIINIITNAQTILIDALYPPLSAATVSPFRQELQKLFFQAPDGFEDFAAPIYHDLMHTAVYSREFLQGIQKKVMGQKVLPESWRQQVLSKLQRELSRIR